MHKAGSTIADQIITEFCRVRGMKIEKISKLVSASPKPEREVFVDYEPDLHGGAAYYGVARGAYVADMPWLYRIRLIIQIRDPRDCLTSSYFSRAISHVPPKNPLKRAEFMQKRENAVSQTIDEYVLNRIKEYQLRLDVIRELVEKHPDVLLLKYEDMVENTDIWLTSVADFLGQPLTGSLESRLTDKLDFTVDGENPSQHKRQVTPGDHLRKLQRETISQLNSLAESQLTYFQYI